MPSRRDSDEAYVINLCEDILRENACRQHRFEWLTGDESPRTHRRRRLPVDAYWPALSLVVEYRERQHDEPVHHFDKPHRLTVSGVHRGLQRKLYDERREKELPKHGIRLIVVRPRDLDSDGRGRLRRNRELDLQALRAILPVARKCV